MTIHTQNSRRREKGSALIEFVLGFALFWVPLFFGMLTVGFNLVRAVQVTQLCRDAAHMYSKGIDFSETEYQTLLLDLAPALKITATGGNGVIILSTMTYIDSAQCTAAGYSSTGCPNYHKTVVTKRIVIGKSSLHASAFASPSSSLISSDGDIPSGDNKGTSGYVNSTSTVTSNFSNLVSLQSGQYSYVAETYVQSSDLNWGGALQINGISALSIF